jgi:preprotein translocase subunit Sec63
MFSKNKLDLYKELEVDRNSTQEEIKKAYKKLAIVSFYYYYNKIKEMASR